MADVNYLLLVVSGAVVAGLLGALAHFWRAHAAIVPEDLGLGEPLNTFTREDYGFEKHIVGAEWDDNGYWDSASPRNLVYYVLSSAGSVLFAGVAFWSIRAEILSRFCGILAWIGLDSPICP